MCDNIDSCESDTYTRKLLTYLIDKYNEYKYVLRPWIFEWIKEKNVSDEEFWKTIAWNNGSGFFMNNYRTLKEFLLHARFTDFEKFEGNGDALELFIDIVDNSHRRLYGGVDWNYVAQNSHHCAVSLIEKNMDKIDDCAGWYSLSLNRNAIHIIEKYIDKIDYFDLWENICKNPSAVNIIERYRNTTKIKDEYLCKNPNPKVLRLIKSIDDEDSWNNIFSNPGARFIIEKNMDKLNDTNRHCLYANPSAIDLIETDLETREIDEYCLKVLCNNINACHLIEKYKERLNVDMLFSLNTNPGAIDFLEKHREFVDISILQNKAIFARK